MKKAGARMSLTELADREAIRNLLATFSTAVDCRDFDLLASCYWPDAEDEHGSFNGPALDFVKWLVDRTRPFIRTQHLMGHSGIEIRGATANVETHFIVYQLQPGATGDLVDEFMGGRYLDLMAFRDDEWRIARRKVVFEWYREMKDPLDWASHPFRKKCFLGTTGSDDPRYEFFARPLPGEADRGA